VTLDNVEHFVGKSLGTSDWTEVDQSRIDQFAEWTDDRQWIHVDVERAEFITLFPLKSEFAAEVACTMFCNGLHSSLHIVRFQ
jgi:acyl dehydratase